MKRFIRVVCLILVLCTVFSVTAFAETVTEPRASSYIAAHDAFLYKTSASQFQIWFDVTACTSVTHLGVSEIEVYKSADKENWTRMRSYKYENYPEMMDYNSGSHTGYVTYNYATTGYYYRAYVTFYAKNSSGTGTIFRYTAALKM